MDRVLGTRDWAGDEFSWQLGCSHDCLYCYGEVYLHEFGSATKTIENWHEEVIREKDVKQGRRKRKHRLIVPSSHDISPEHLDEAIEVLDNFLNLTNTPALLSPCCWFWLGSQVTGMRVKKQC